MGLVEDDSEINPEISAAQLQYVRNLTDKHSQYTRFLDGLLIARPSHAAFFRDLIAFRALPTTIHALSLCNPDDSAITKEQRKQNYRDVTSRFLGSRFAHPWCRKSAAGKDSKTGGGWWGAEWAATGRKMSREQQEQEEKLHKDLLPLWISFRSRMFPGEAIVEEWWKTRQLEARPASRGPQASTSPDIEISQAGPTSYKELSMAACHNNPPNNDDNDADEDNEGENLRLGAAAATGLLRIAAAGMLISSMPKMQQWKLKRELKKKMR